MPLVPVNLTNKTNPARYKQGGDAQLVNCYVERTGEEGKVDWAIYAIDGLEGFAQVVGASGGIRALLPIDNYIYFVSGLSLYRCDATGNISSLGSMQISTTKPVYMERNRRANVNTSTPDIAIVCDGLMYYYRTETSTFAQVTDVDLLAPTSLAFLDGYFIIGTQNNKWQIGAIDDASAWDALDYARGDANPDAVVRVSAQQRDAVIFGEVSTEFWRNTGAADFPFERVATNEYGCLAPDSVVITMQGLTWVAHDRTVRVMNGYDAQRISTHALEREIQKLENFDDLRATTWTNGGHSFYCLTCNDWTWVYDSITGLWHTRKSTIDGVDQPNWRILKVDEFNGIYIAADRDKPILYKMSADYFSEAGNTIKVKVTLPPVNAYPKRITVNSFYIDMEKGVGSDATGDTEDQDPEVILRWSRDGGYTFSTERKFKLGKQGTRTQRLRTYRLGQSNPDGYVFQIEAPSKTVRALYQCMADVVAE